MRILFTASNCLVDPASGAAISVRTILKLLADRGHQVMSVTSACFDRSPFTTEAEMLRWSGFDQGSDAVWRMQDGPLLHTAVPAGHVGHGDLSRTDLLRAAEKALPLALDFAPDLAITFGGSVFEHTMRQGLAARRAKIAFYLANPGYHDMATFKGANVILTDSIATQNLYAERLGLSTEVIGKFIRRPTSRPTGGPGFITFVNPSYDKGVTLFFRIAEMMRDVLPVARFMVVESRANLDRIESETGLPFSRLRSVRRIGLQSDMADVFSSTRALVMPSLWHESGGRTAIEAISLGIPVVASNHCGLSEHLADGASLIRVPDTLRNNPRLIPPQAAALPWVSVLSSLWSDPEYHAEKSAAALARWAHLDPTSRVDYLEKLFVRTVAA